MARSKRDESVRLNLEVNPAVRERLERLKGATEAESLTEVIRRALAVYEVLIDLSPTSREIVIRDSKGKERNLVLVP